MTREKLKGYYDFPVEDGTKRLNFGMNFVINLQDYTQMDLIEWSEKAKENIDDHIYTLTTLCDIVYAAMWAHDQVEGNDPDYSIYKVRDWVISVYDQQPEKIEEMREVMTHSLGAVLGKPLAEKTKNPPQKASTSINSTKPA